MYDLGKMMMAMATMGNYEDRKVAEKYVDGPKMVSTCSVTDGALEFETAVAHPEFNEGQIVIVAAYATKEDAILGHELWTDLLKTDKLGDSLLDVDNAGILGQKVTFKKGEGWPL